MSDHPIRQQARHRSKILSLRERVVRAWEDMQSPGDLKGFKQSLTLVERHEFVAIALDDERRGRNGFGCIIAIVPQTLLEEPIGQSDSSRTSGHIRNRPGAPPLGNAVLPLFAEFEPEHLGKI